MLFHVNPGSIDNKYSNIYHPLKYTPFWFIDLTNTLLKLNIADEMIFSREERNMKNGKLYLIIF